MKWTFLCLFFFLLCACSGNSIQSSLSSVGPAADSIENLFWFLLISLTLVFIFTLATLAKGFWGKKSSKHPEDKFILGLGVVMPVFVLSAILIYSLTLSFNLKTEQEGSQEQLKIVVTGHQWWWEVEYPQLDIVTANEIHIPAGKDVIIELRSSDVIHSFWVPSLHGKLDALPDHSNYLVLRADRPGTYRGQCAEYCGTSHALMALYTIALKQEDFDAWVEDRKRPALVEVAAAKKGKEVFFKASCDNCHNIKGTEADGAIGPDLTHVGSRLSLGAGTIPNGHGSLAGWVANPQAIKPGNFMPPTYLSPEDLDYLTEYLMSLK